jgi:hypothetical protein
MMKVNDPAGMSWSQGTARGSAEAELRVWTRLSLRQKLEAAEALSDLSRRFAAVRRKQGLPCIDPVTGEVLH